MEDTQQAEYLQEIRELQAKLAELQENESAPTVIEEYATEIKILVALLDAARELRDKVAAEPELGEHLVARGYKPDRFRDIYAFVYEQALEIEQAGVEFAQAIRATDFAALLG
jgi:ketosteroid isomerase-like protein